MRRNEEKIKSINYQMTQLYGVKEHYSCKECAKFDPETKVCSEARAKVVPFWVACGRFREAEK